MKITRRGLLAAGAGTGTCLTLGLQGSLAAAFTNTDIIRKAIPASGEHIPVIGMGTNRWLANAPTEEFRLQREILQIFLAAGGRVIDTAPSYRTSEQALSRHINELGLQDAFFMATKVDRELREEGINRMEASLKTLGRTHVDLMQVHNLRGADVQLATLFKWRDAGRIRYVGITTSRNDQHAETAALMRRHPLDFVQVNYSLADRAAGDVILPLARDRGIAVMVNLPLARGQLFQAVADTPLPDWAAEFDCRSWAQFFLKYVVSHPAVSCAIPGMTKARHARDNMQANQGRLPDEAFRKRQEALIDELL